MSISDMATHEQAVAIRLVDDLLARGYAISVFDSEEETVTDSVDRAEVLGALCTTDDDVISAGPFSFWLVYGNNEGELISDYSCERSQLALADEIFDHAIGGA